MTKLTTKAAVLENLNAPLELHELEVPDLDYGQVLVQVHYSGICGAQIGEISGVKGEDKFLPHLMGHEGGGVVVETGPGVSYVRKGDHVVMHWRKGMGIESSFPKYRDNGRFVGAGLIATFTQYAVVSENRLTAIPDDIPLDIAALMGCAVTTALGLINNEAKLKFGESIAVIGCGGVGLNVIQGAVMASAHPIIAIDINDCKLELAKQFGATNVINSSRNDIRDEIVKIVGSQGVDVFVEHTGKVELIAQAYELTAPFGRAIMVGQPRYDQSLNISSMLKNFSGKILTDSQGGQTVPHKDIPRYLNLYRTGKLKLDNLITHRFPLVEINTAIDQMRSENTARCILEMC